MTLFVSTWCSAQIYISGTVTETGNKPLPYVNVVWVGTEKGTVTNESGEYSIELDNNTTGELEFSALGFRKQLVPILDRRTINVILQEGAQALDEVVLNAFGLKRETKELGYVVQSLDTEDVTEVKSITFLDNLSGKLAGVSISQGATGVGSSSKITIRGEASFSNNNPLFVVDRIPINNNSVFNFTNEAAAGFQEIDFGNGAMEVNPDDIAAVSVLKGPSAAAFYGTRASKGVIVIETRNRSDSKGLGISYIEYEHQTTYQLVREHHLPIEYAEPLPEAEKRLQGIPYNFEKSEKIHLKS